MENYKIFLFCMTKIFFSYSQNLENNINTITRINRIFNWIDYNAEESNQNIAEEVLVVSLGGDCMSAYEIYKHGLRKAAFPFDRIVSSLQGIKNCIENDFESFLDPIFLKKHSILLHCIENIKYGFAFAHDFPYKIGIQPAQVVNNFLDFLPEAQAKYKRRIARFRDLQYFKGTVFFLRTNTAHVIENQKQDIVKIYESLKKIFNNLNFKIILVGGAEEYKIPWKIPNIYNFYIDKIKFFDLQTDLQYGRIFNEFHIKTEYVTKPVY